MTDACPGKQRKPRPVAIRRWFRRELRAVASSLRAPSPLLGHATRRAQFVVRSRESFVVKEAETGALPGDELVTRSAPKDPALIGDQDPVRLSRVGRRPGDRATSTKQARARVGPRAIDSLC
jgi:hypothetical protein